MSPNLPSSFFARMGLKEEDRGIYTRGIGAMYPGYKPEELEEQGYCSFTLLLTPTPQSLNCGRIIIQIRPEKHTLNPEMIEAARETYSAALVPQITRLECDFLADGFHAFEMTAMDGVPYSTLQVKKTVLDDRVWERQVALVESFASFVARAWPSSSSITTTTIPTSNSATTSRSRSSTSTPSTPSPTIDIPSKLTILSNLLPSAPLRAHASSTIASLNRLKRNKHPVVLNHGDLIPSNMLVDPSTLEIRAIVDWAEAAYLPFGTHLYGLEHVLGYLEMGSSAGSNTSFFTASTASSTESGDDSTSTSTSSTTSTTSPPNPKPQWKYYTRAPELRALFWTRLCAEAPGLTSEALTDAQLARDVGVLLWYGYAWDGGRVDRVVDETVDGSEVACLQAFLGVGGTSEEWDGGGEAV